MSVNYFIECKRAYLLVQHTSNFELTAEMINQFWVNLAAACKISGHKRILWEGKITAHRLTTAEIYYSASQPGQIALGLKLACVFGKYLPDEQTRFFKSVALRKGAIIDFFSERQAALQWLGLAADPISQPSGR